MTKDNQSISTDHPDAVTYRRAADAFRAGDLDALATSIHEDVIWHLPGTTWMARDFKGRRTLLAFMREVIERTNGTFQLQDVRVSVTGGIRSAGFTSTTRAPLTSSWRASSGEARFRRVCHGTGWWRFPQGQ